MEPSDDNFFLWVDSILDADYFQEFLSEAGIKPRPIQNSGELSQRFDSLPNPLDRLLTPDANQASSCQRYFPSTAGSNSRVELSVDEAGQGVAHNSSVEYRKSTATSSRRLSLRNFDESNQCVLSAGQDLNKSALREIFLRGMFIPNSSRAPGDKLPVYQSLHMDRIEMGMPDLLIQENMFLLAEAIITNDSAKLVFYSNALRDEALPHGRPIQRLLSMCLSGLHLRMKFGLRQPLRSLMELQPAVQEAWAQFGNKTPLVALGFETACGSIMDAIEGCSKVHIIDFGSWPQLWTVLLKKMAAQAQQPPYVRITIVLTASSSSFTKANFPKIAREIYSLAGQLSIPVEISSLHIHMEHIHAGIFQCSEDEAVLVNSSLYLHQLPDSSVLRFSPRDKIIEAVHDLNPKLVRVMDLTADLNSNFFLARFKTLVTFYEALFTSVECSFRDDVETARAVEASYFQEQILNVISCEGLNRWFRPESSEKLIARFSERGLGVYPYSEERIAAMKSIMAGFPSFELRANNGFAELYFNNVSISIYVNFRVMM